MKINEIINEDISPKDLENIKNSANKLFQKIGIDVAFTKHFLDRVNDPRNGKPITVAEMIRLFKQTYKKWGKPIVRLGPDARAILKDLQTDINLPFVLVWDSKNEELDMVATTIKRQQNFSTRGNPVFPIGGPK